MRELVSKAFNPSKIFIVLKSELIKKGRNEKKGPAIGSVLIQAASFMHGNSEDRLSGVLALEVWVTLGTG